MSPVYFLKDLEVKKIKKLLPKFSSGVGVKVHFGEENNTTFIPAEKIKQITHLLKEPVLIECNVLYKSPRQQGESHKKLAQAHGFNFAPLDILDGVSGDEFIIQEIPAGRHFKSAYLGKGIKKYRELLVISHLTGHLETGFGAALKNSGMGLAARRGKLALHASIKHQVNPEKCTGCGICLDDCPVAAISFDPKGKAHIDQQTCISCSACLAVCPVQAISIPWSSTAGNILQERISEYALAVSTGRKCFYLNFLQNITAECDCANRKLNILTADIGVLLSPDPVAIDQSSYDLVVKQSADFAKHKGSNQIKHGEEIGLGSKKYELINL